MDCRNIRFTVVTCTYNAERTVKTTLDSVMGQTWRNVEHIIMDGGSADGTVAIAGAYKAESDATDRGHEVVIVSEPDNGLYDAMNKALGRATGDYVVFMNAGDSYPSPHTLGDIAACVGTDGELPAVLSGGQGPGEAVSEAECMRRELIRRGIAPERLYIEDASASTYENIVFSKRIIEQNGLPSDIVIITNGYHAFRASCIARDLGMRRGTYSACTALWMLPPFYVRELYAVLYHFFMMHNPFLTHASDCDFASE